MPFHFTCPYCYKKTLVDDALAGQSGPCAGCGKEVSIPAIDAPDDSASRSPADDQAGANTTIATSRANILRTWGLKLVGLVVLVAFLTSVAVFLFWPVFQGLKRRRDRIACSNNLQLIANALNAYAENYGTYPPPIVYDKKGKPLHSWRVLILNELGEEALYAKYNFNSAWDSTENAMLLDQCPRVFVSPAADDPWGSESTYFLVTGNGTMFPKTGPLGPDSITDPLSTTLLVVEAQNAMNEWTKPMDVEFSKLNSTIGAAGPNTIGGNHPDGATAVFADGTPAWLPNDLDPIMLDAIITPRGGEPVDAEDFQIR